jgi:predicted  nucleic acid-binding Zn-ribbon protein
LTDEEIEDQLNRAKEDETFFQKKVAALRKEYKELEDKQIKANEEQAAAEKEEQFNQLAQSLVSVARDTEEMNGMLLDDQDKEDVLSFLLDRDANGQSEFYKLFSDPKALFKMAWTMLKGDQAHETYTQYFTNEIAKARRGTKT